jgi:hypothetical protein
MKQHNQNIILAFLGSRWDAMMPNLAVPTSNSGSQGGLAGGCLGRCLQDAVHDEFGRAAADCLKRFARISCQKRKPR